MPGVSPGMFGYVPYAWQPPKYTIIMKDGNQSLSFFRSGNVVMDGFDNVIEAADFFRKMQTIDVSLTMKFDENITALITSDYRVTLSYTPDARTQSFWDAVSNVNGYSQLTLPFKDDSDVCTSAPPIKAEVAPPEPAFDFDAYNGLK